ncbi:SMP-30/gluconolactonase/LRE family protein [Salibaculum halophilum]|uniref:SMP-30/gluconolactonase/LRE family protein n=1 Tax=Salibaculum halophilum TaxID=1914408 RepID=UPI000A117E78|nr:SMP-30/gluconolactonase/LRE family protein [Salibaculum halophilum]
MIHDETQCTLGEGPLWHPKRQELFWFDILGKRLHRNGQHWQFDDYVSAAGWVDDATLLVADAAGLFLFDLETGAREDLVALEADNPATRSNDGRADPHGGFWIGTMGIKAEPGAGAIFRYYRGELRQLHAGLTIPNAICFSPDGGHVHFTDTPTRRILRQRLSARDGWPEGAPEPWLDLAAEGLNPDGAVIDAAGNFWNAQWGAGRVACYSPDGGFAGAVEFNVTQTSCPAFGGPDLKTLFCTSAAEGLSDPDPDDGKTFSTPVAATGQQEHRVIL